MEVGDYVMKTKLCQISLYHHYSGLSRDFEGQLQLASLSESCQRGLQHGIIRVTRESSSLPSSTPRTTEPLLTRRHYDDLDTARRELAAALRLLGVTVSL